jgi:hypothetical protein
VAYLPGNGCRSRTRILRDKDVLANLGDGDEDATGNSDSLGTRGVEWSPQSAERVVVVPRRIGRVVTVCVNLERGQPRLGEADVGRTLEVVARAEAP